MIVQNKILHGIIYIVLLIFFAANLIGCFNQDQKKISELLEQGINSVREGDIREGIQKFNQVIKLDPKNYLAYYNRGIAYRDMKDYKNAIYDLNSCIEIDPNDSRAYFQLGWVWSDQGELEKGISYYSKVIEIDPKFTDAYGARGIMKAMAGKVESAAEDLNTAIGISPNDPLLFIIRAQILQEKGDCRGAIEDYKKAMSFNPERINTKIDIAWILAACPDRNIRDGKKVLKLTSEFSDSNNKPYLLRTIAAAYADIGDFKNAVIYQKRAIEAYIRFVPKDKLAKMFYDKDRTKYLEQLESYENNKPWYF